MKTNKDIYPEDLPPMRRFRVICDEELPLVDYKREMADYDAGKFAAWELIIALVIGFIVLLAVYWR